MAKFTTQSQTTETVDYETGEVRLIETTKQFNVKIETEEFFMTYTKFISSLYGLTKLSDLKLLVKFCEVAEYNTGVVQLTTASRIEICKELNIGLTNISKNIKSLIKKGLITGSFGNYTINPHVFWKGDRKTRAQVLKTDGLALLIKLQGENE
jgi:Firmicute plasmid replication protein (RepL).